jgi:hypothetical protein
MADGDASTLITVPTRATGSGTIRLVEEVICARVLDGVHFDFDFTFVRPEAKPIIREIVDDVNRDTRVKVLVAGHTDRVGSSAYNQGLSDRRARSVFGYITNQTGIWMDLLRTMLSTGGATVPRTGSGQSADRWQVREFQYILGYLRSSVNGEHFYSGPLDNIAGSGTQAALNSFRSENGLPPGGDTSPKWAGVDESTWEMLFQRYIQVDAAQVDPARFLTPSMLGCGESFPRIETRPKGTESQERQDANARLETNRRVEFLLVPPALVPSQVTCESIYKNPDSPIVACPGNPQPITVTLHFVRAEDNKKPMAGLVVTITGQGGASKQATTDAQGKIVLADNDTTQGDFRVSAVGNFGLALRDKSQGQVRGAEVLLHLTRSTTVEILVASVPVRLNFVQNQGNFDQLLDTLANPLDGGPVEFKLAANVDDVVGDTITVLLSSFLLRGPASPVPGQPGGGGGIATPPTPLEFVDLSDVVLTETALNTRFKLRLDSSEVTGETVTVMLSSHWFRKGQP